MVNRYKSILAVILLLGVVVPMVGAVTWNIEDARVLPKWTSFGSEGVVIAHLSDRNGNPITPNRCAVDFIYDYAGGQTSQSMVHAGMPSAWYYNDTLQFTDSDSSLTLTASGNCDINTNPTSQTLTFDKDGDMRVTFLNDTSENYAEEEFLRLEWNVTKSVPFGTEFVENANVTYTLYDMSMNVIDASDSSWDVKRENKRYTAEVELPKQGGMYVLSVLARNNSLSMQNPYGGAARAIWVEPTYLKGEGDIHAPASRCDLSGADPVCEKGTRINVSFHEDYADADYVNVTVRGSTDGYSDGPLYKRFTLTRQNKSYWYGDFYFSRNFDTATYGNQLDVTITGVHKYERNGDHEMSENKTTKTIKISPFKLVDSTQPFVRLGNKMKVAFGIVSKISGYIIDPQLISRIDIAVRNKEGGLVYRNTLKPPLNDSYDEETTLFFDTFTVPFNTSIGEHTATVEVQNAFGVNESLEIPFEVLPQSELDTPLAIVAAGGDLNKQNITKTYIDTGKWTEKVFLRNLADSPVTMDVSFTGDLKGNARWKTENDTITFEPGGSEVIDLEFDLRESKTYNGQVVFQMGGSYFEPQNLTMPVQLYVRCKHAFANICVTYTDLHPKIRKTGNHQLEVGVRNNGSYSSRVNLQPQGNLSTIMDRNAVDVPAGNTTVVSMPFRVEMHDSGMYRGNVIVSTYGGSITLDGSADINISQTEISVTADETDLGEFVEGNTVTINVTVENTGTEQVETVSVFSSELGIDTTKSVPLSPGNKTHVTVTGTAPGNQQKVNVSFQPPEGMEEVLTFQLQSYKDYSREISDLRQVVRNFRQQLDKKSKSEEKERVVNKLSQMGRALNKSEQFWEQGRYSAAKRNYQNAQSYESTIARQIESLDKQKDNKGGGGLGGLGPLLIPMVVILVLVAVGGVIIYLSIAPEDEETASPY